MEAGPLQSTKWEPATVTREQPKRSRIARLLALATSLILGYFVVARFYSGDTVFLWGQRFWRQSGEDGKGSKYLLGVGKADITG
jgi:hypothetical protein